MAIRTASVVGGSTERRGDASTTAAFWFLAALLASLLFSASAPSPLYPIYQASWHFSPGILTAVYAVYAFGALAALLTAGRLSDHIGRRSVTVAGLLVQVAAMLVFIEADGVPALFLARVLQGVGTGVASGAISAWILDLQPPDRPRLGSLVTSVALIGGLALGALGSGLLAQYAPDPLHLVFWLLVAAYVAAIFVTLVVPDRVARRPGGLASMRPDIAVPRAARQLFAASAPSLVAVWAVAGLYLSLGSSLAISLTHTQNHVAGGLVVMALLGAGSVASFAIRRSDPAVLALRGSLLLIVGVAITLLAVAVGSAPGLYIGSIIAGIGFGPAFSGIFRSLAPLADEERRGALIAAIYVVVYLSFSVPSIAAGIAVGVYGLQDTTYGFGLVVIALAAITTFAVSRRPPRAEVTA